MKKLFVTIMASAVILTGIGTQVTSSVSNPNSNAQTQNVQAARDWKPVQNVQAARDWKPVRDARGA